MRGRMPVDPRGELSSQRCDYRVGLLFGVDPILPVTTSSQGSSDRDDNEHGFCLVLSRCRVVYSKPAFASF